MPSDSGVECITKYSNITGYFNFTEYFDFTGYFYSIDKFLFLISISSSSCQSLDNFEEKTTFRTGYGLPHKKMIHTKPTKLIFSTITISLV